MPVNPTAPIDPALISAFNHDIRGPLTVLQGLLPLLKSASLQPAEQEILRDCLDAAERVVRMNSNLSDYVKLPDREINAKVVPTHPLTVPPTASPILLIPLLERVVKRYQGAGEARQLTVVLQDESDDSGHQEIQVCHSSKRLEQLFCNLVSSALEFAPAHSKIEISVGYPLKPSHSKSSKMLRVTVSDDGISPDINAPMEMFTHPARERLRTAGCRYDKGLSLLTIPHEVAVMGITVEASSKEKETNTGCVILVYLIEDEKQK